MPNDNDRNQDKNNPREIPVRKDPGKQDPIKDHDMEPSKQNPKNPRVDE